MPSKIWWLKHRAECKYFTFTIKHVHTCIEKNLVLCGKKHPYRQMCWTVTTHPKPHLCQKQTSIFPLLLFSFLSLPSHAVFISSSISFTLLLPPPVWSLTIQLTNMEQEDRRISTDHHTLLLPCFSRRQFWQDCHTRGINLITSVPHHTLVLFL